MLPSDIQKQRFASNSTLDAKNNLGVKIDNNAAAKQSSKTKRAILIGIPLAIVLFTVQQYVKEHRRTIVESEGPVANAKNYLKFGGDGAPQVLENPRLSWFERIFCTGYQKSSMCSNRPLHPLYEYYVEDKLKDVPADVRKQQYGINPEEPRVPGTRSEQVHPKPQALKNVKEKK